MFVSSTRARARSSGFLRRLGRLSLAVLRAFIVGGAALGPPRPPPEPPPPQTSAQVDERSSERE